MTKRKKAPSKPASRDSLAELFGSARRSRLLMLLSTAQAPLALRDVAKRIGTKSEAVAKEARELARVGFVGITTGFEGKRKVKFITLEPTHALAPELKNLLIKAQLALSNRFARAVEDLGNVNYLALVGVFTGVATPVDVLVVGRMGKNSIERMVTNLERELGRTINYVVLTPDEFDERRALPDKFLYGILESRKIVLVDKIGLV